MTEVVVARSHKGRDLGGVLLDFACQRAIELEKKYVRLDCWRDNTGLHEYYKQHEFRHLRTEEVDDRMSGALFERDARCRTRGDVQLIVEPADKGE